MKENNCHPKAPDFSGPFEPSKSLSLPPRLMAAARLFKGETLADIGCDHGYLSAYLLLFCAAKYAIACDINTGPLKKARETVALFGLNGKMETRLGPGLSVVSALECDTIFICGMGGENIASILSSAPFKIDDHHLILQPQSKKRHLRRFLFESGFHIEDEILALDSGRIYSVISAKKGTGCCGQSNRFLFADSMRKEPLFAQYIKDLHTKYSTAYHGQSLGKNPDNNLKEDIDFLESELNAT